MKHIVPLALMALLISAPVTAHDALSLAELMKAFGWDFDTTEITIEKVGDTTGGTTTLVGVAFAPIVGCDQSPRKRQTCFALF